MSPWESFLSSRIVRNRSAMFILVLPQLSDY
jgi:hypothetical protein